MEMKPNPSISMEYHYPGFSTAKGNRTEEKGSIGTKNATICSFLVHSRVADETDDVEKIVYI